MSGRAKLTELQQLFAPFSRGQQQILVAGLLAIRAAGLTGDEVLDYAATLAPLPVSSASPVPRPTASRRTCRECGGLVRTVPVNDSPATMIGGGYKWADQCRNTRCLYTHYR